MDYPDATFQFFGLPLVSSSIFRRTASSNSSGFLALNQTSAPNIGTKLMLKLRQRMLLKH